MAQNLANERFDDRYFQMRYAKTLATGKDDRNFELFLNFLRLRPGDRVLDVGCGLGTFAAVMSRCGADVLGVDVSSSAIGEAQRRYPDLTFLVVDALHLYREFEPGSFDAITCIQVLEHIPPDKVDDLICQLAQVLRDGGCLLLNMPVTDNLSDRWLMLRNRYLKGLSRPSTAIDSSFDPTHLWKIGDLDLLIDRFETYDLEAEMVRKLYYVPWIVARLNWGYLLGYLPGRWMEQFLKGGTVLFRKGTAGTVSQTVGFSAFWSDPPGARGLVRLKRLLA